ncbi:ExbD/TolR family protein [Phycisphaera mikurensis]|uniref:ExbD/TolR family protein n=1 Tax=Phycisphaera mikurensis (strain NBRC 102666 / KCTC 22515 / FYK2301M01) TaxID=1142394 RepID=I0IAA3_PHYMF|nr:biopolymer transporter ExbD [Phycisphaera mikurensis]MBB6441809.1 biopolymer transport protein ExbD [Phycisphaera mikurensis]BAM02191.1 ExbD/TolR family protein [Phycisphaera mikurensis NBRC 102666]
MSDARPRSRRGRGAARVGQLNLTSMIDVIFLLLIYFVITANFQVDEGVLEAQLPRGTGQPPPLDELPVQKVVIEIAVPAGDDTAAVITRGRRRYAGVAELRDDLAAQRRGPGRSPSALYESDHPILIEADPAVRWQHTVDAFNAAVAAGYTRVAMK